jgi:hypothetical protein
MSWTQEQIDDTLRRIVERSLTDPDFRLLAIRDGHAAIHAVSDARVPADFEVRFVDNAGADMTIVLPDARSTSDIEEQELAGVAGGAGIGVTFACNLTVNACNIPTLNCTRDNLTACNPAFTKKPGSPAFCP